MSESVNTRLARLETRIDSHIVQQDKNWTTMFGLVNDKIMPAVESAKNSKDRLDKHEDGHWKSRALFATIVGLSLTGLNFLLSHIK